MPTFTRCVCDVLAEQAERLRWVGNRVYRAQVMIDHERERVETTLC